MPVDRVRFALLLSGVALAAAFGPDKVHAQCSSCQNSQPAAITYQPTTAYQVSGAPAPYYGGNACNTCQPAVQPMQYQPVQVQPLYNTPAYRPIPRTSYRSQWTPNTTTYYSPYRGVSPTTGAPVISYRACQTRGQIMQRVPTSGCFSSPATSYAPSTGCSSCTPAATYAPPATITVPSTIAPSTFAPTPVPPSTIAPGPARTTAPDGNVPAESRPSLKPEARTNAQGASIRGLQLQPPNSSSIKSSTQSTTPTLDPPSPRFRVQPVPDPDATEDDNQPAGEAPPLLDPRHKTAARPSNMTPTYAQFNMPIIKPASNRVRTTVDYKSTPKPPALSTGWKTVDW
jgi:hypothetical protein